MLIYICIQYFGHIFTYILVMYKSGISESLDNTMNFCLFVLLLLWALFLDFTARVQAQNIILLR